MSESTTDSERHARILDAALVTFSAYGPAKTSMADIAGEAGMSRPALYQYFQNKEDILVAVVVRVMGDAADRSIDALEAPGPFDAQLDGFLQRWFGDLLAQFRTTAHGIDLIEIKTGRAKPAIDLIADRVREAALVHLRQAGAENMIDLVMLSPAGLKADGPSVARYRKRLSALAASVAATIGHDAA